MSKQRAGIYTRVSTGSQKERYSLPAQEAMLREYAKKHSFDVVKHYQDPGISAKNIIDRPDLQELMKDCEAGKLDCVLAVELDRTTRNVEDMLFLSKFFQKHDIQYIELDCEDTSIHTADGFLKRTIKSTISQYERMHTAERVKRTKFHRAKQGKFQGGKPPFGFTSLGTLVKELQKAEMTEGEAMQVAGKRCPEKGRLYPIPEEVKIVKEMYHLFLSTNSLRKTAYTLNGKGYQTHKGSWWSAESIRRILKSEVYLGKMIYGKNPMGSDGKRIRKEKREWTIAEGDHDPIITQEQFDQVQNLLASHQKPRRAGRVYLLSGLVRCGFCSGPMVGYSLTKGGKRYSYYRCNRKEQHGETACQGLRLRAESVENFVIKVLLNLVSDEVFLSDTQQHMDELRSLLRTSDITQDVEQIDREIRQNHRRIDKILDAYEDGLIDKTDFKGRYQNLKERLSSLESTRIRSLEQANNQHVSFAAMESSFEDMLKFGHDWEFLSEEGKQQRLQQVVKEIRVTKTHVDIDLIVEEGWELSHLCRCMRGQATGSRTSCPRSKK